MNTSEYGGRANATRTDDDAQSGGALGVLRGQRLRLRHAEVLALVAGLRARDAQTTAYRWELSSCRTKATIERRPSPVLAAFFTASSSSVLNLCCSCNE